MVGPVGRLEVLDGATNLIPGRCELWLDIPSGDDTTRAAVADVMAAIDRIAWHLVSGAGHDAMMFNGRRDVAACVLIDVLLNLKPAG